eukprot:gene15445-17024_t
MLDKKIFTRFKAEQEAYWERFLGNIEAPYKESIQCLYRTKFEYEEVVFQYEKTLLENLFQQFGSNAEHLKDTKGMDKVFDDLFEKLLSDVKQKYPMIVVSDEVDKEYKRFPEITIKNATKNTQGTEDRSWWKVNQEQNHSKLDVFYVELEKETEAKLKKVTFYSSNIVCQTIESVREVLEREGITSKEKKSMIHSKIRSYLENKLTAIQMKWNEEHHIPTKLKHDKEILKTKFYATCDGIVDSNMIASVTTVIMKGITSTFEDKYTEILAAIVKANLHRQPWLTDAKVMQAHVDLHLLSLGKREDKSSLLSAINHSGFLYHSVVRNLVTQEIKAEPNFTRLKKNLIEAIQQASSTDQFKKKFNKILDPCFKNCLPNSIWLGFDKIKKQDYKEIARIVTHEVANIVKVPDYNEEQLILEVFDFFSQDTTKPQLLCTETCPRCHMTCKKAALHTQSTLRSERKHDSNHRIEGLGGIQWVSGEYKDELLNSTCGDGVKNGYYMVIGERRVPYQKFTDEYKDWEIPKIEFCKVTDVQKHLFCKYQEDLAMYYGKKPCSHATGKYDEDELENQLNAIINGT